MMNAFQLQEYYRYRRAAKGRHGVHSPFVYRLIDEALRPPAKQFSEAAIYVSASGEVWQPDILPRRLAHHLGFGAVIVVHAGAEQAFCRPGTEGKNCHCLYDWKALPPEAWAGQFQERAAAFSDNDAIVLHHIHCSAAHAAAWQDLCRRESVQLSLDLFRFGLLIFNQNFKERQHFVLKYPA